MGCLVAGCRRPGCVRFGKTGHLLSCVMVVMCHGLVGVVQHFNRRAVAPGVVLRASRRASDFGDCEPILVLVGEMFLNRLIGV
jgi:hypothetical protein